MLKIPRNLPLAFKFYIMAIDSIFIQVKVYRKGQDKILTLQRDISYDGQCKNHNNCGQLTSLNHSYWMQCCTTDNCNDTPIPVNITSIEELQKCYKGLTREECIRM